MDRRVALGFLIVAAVVLAFLGGLAAGRGERTTIPDLYGLQGQLGRDASVVERLHRVDLRIGRTRFYVCGGRRTYGMVVKQFPRPGESAPVGSAVDIWVALPVGSTLLDDRAPSDAPCRPGVGWP
jgi:hypothetical protein